MTASTTTTVEIDIDVHRAIEARRATFDQSHNDILRTVFGLSKAAPGLSEPMAPAPSRTYTTGDVAAYFNMSTKTIRHHTLRIRRASHVQRENVPRRVEHAAT